MKKEANVFISIDWLSLFCSGKVNSSSKYQFVETECSSRVFTKIFKVIRKNKPFAVVQAVPRGVILKPDALIVKFENSLLYEVDGMYIIQEFIEDLQWTVNNISRLDICGDFLGFENGLSVQKFIQRLMSHFYLFNNKCECHVYFTSDYQNSYNGLTVGKRSSPVHTILYNKTKEMAEVKTKAHIIELWQKVGLVCDKDVYRIEFRMNSDYTSKVQGLGTENKKMDYKDLASYEFVKRIWYSLFLEKFNVKINDNQQNKTRMQNLELLKVDCCKVEKITITQSKDCGRMEKILVNKLEQIRLSSFDMEVAEINSLTTVMEYLLDSRNLKDYYYTKHPAAVLLKY